MAGYLLVTDSCAPLVSSGESRSIWGLARGLVSAGHKVTILTLAGGDAIARIPGLARRLSKVTAYVAGRATETSLFEGRFSASDPQVLVIESAARDATEAATVLATAASSMVSSGLLSDEVAVAWGEAAAAVLAPLPAQVKLFVLTAAPRALDLSEGEAALLGLGPEDPRSLAAVGVLSSHAVVVPSLKAEEALGNHPALAGRASDEPIVPLVFGCDEPPFDPASDTTLAATFSPEKPAGRAECRRWLARHLRLLLDPVTPLVALAPLRHAREGATVLAALERLVRRDGSFVVPAWGDADLVERARILTIEHPTRVALMPDEGGLVPAGDDEDDARPAWRRMLAGADAVLLTNSADMTGREAGRALLYGAVPLVPAESAAGRRLVDLDGRSETGVAVVYDRTSVAALESAVTRVWAARQRRDLWADLILRLGRAVPGWVDAAARLDSLRAVTGADAGPLAPSGAITSG
jgi:hypothetical protein